MSGPGQPLMLGFVASAALLIAFLLGFELGQGETRTAVVTGVAPSGSEQAPPGSASEDAALLQPPLIDQRLQQAYYANHQLGSWVVCQQRATLACQAVRFSPLDPGRAFDSAATHWGKVQTAALERGARTYLVGDISRLWMGDVAARPVGAYRDLQGVTLNGVVQYYDLGDLEAGRYVVIQQWANAFTGKGPVTVAIGLAVE